MTFTDILTQTRNFMRVDSTQYPTSRIVASANNWKSRLDGYAIGADKRFQWDNTEHTKLPIGTTNLVADQDEYSFLTDEQGNRILTLTRIDCKDSEGNWRQLIPIDQAQISPIALDEFMKTSADPIYYDKISDNVIKLYPASDTTVASGLKFYFQRSSPVYTTSSTTEGTGFAPMLDRGFVIASAYDGAITLGLGNLEALSIELAKEEQKMVEYFMNRTNDEVRVLRGRVNNYK